jgi:hypothetical protein
LRPVIFHRRGTTVKDAVLLQQASPNRAFLPSYPIAPNIPTRRLRGETVLGRRRKDIRDKGKETQPFRSRRSGTPTPHLKRSATRMRRQRCCRLYRKLASPPRLRHVF